MSSVVAPGGPGGDRTPERPLAWQEPAGGTPVTTRGARLWPWLPGRAPGHSTQGNWGMAAAPTAAPQFFQFPMPIPLAAEWGDSGTGTLFMTHIAQAQPPPRLVVAARWWGQEVAVAIRWGRSPPKPGPARAHRRQDLDFVSVPCSAVASGDLEVTHPANGAPGNCRPCGFSPPSRPCRRGAASPGQRAPASEPPPASGPRHQRAQARGRQPVPRTHPGELSVAHSSAKPR